MEQYLMNRCYQVEAALKKIERNLPEFDSILLRDYLEWESEVERWSFEFPHSSRQLGAIIEKKLVGYIGSCWRIHKMGRKKDVSWKYIKRGLREILDADEAMEEGAVMVVEESHNHIVEEPADDSYALTAEIDKHVIELENEFVNEGLEFENQEDDDMDGIHKEERVVIAFVKPEEFRVVDAIDPIDEVYELQESNVCPEVTTNVIDRVHDEWHEIVGKHQMGCIAEGEKVDCVDSERLWELLFQRGFDEQDELHEPSSTGHIYLTFFEFCRVVFDPGGNSIRFEDESFQEGENDINQAIHQFHNKIQV